MLKPIPIIEPKLMESMNTLAEEISKARHHLENAVEVIVRHPFAANILSPGMDWEGKLRDMGELLSVELDRLGGKT